MVRGWGTSPSLVSGLDSPCFALFSGLFGPDYPRKGYVMKTGTIVVGGAVFHQSGKTGFVLEIFSFYLRVETLWQGSIVQELWCIDCLA